MSVKCTMFLKFMETGASRPFLGISEAVQKFVVKVHGNPQGEKSIFNELVAGRLAALLNLPWPTVSIVCLADRVMELLVSEGLPVLSPWAVGLGYVEGLRAAPWPTGGYAPGSEFARRNAEHIRTLVPHASLRVVFYGKMVFDNWVMLGDPKYDGLHLGLGGTPFFLDGSYAFGGLNWDGESLEWEPTSIDICSPYLEGVLTNLTYFESWLEKLIRISHDAIEDALSSIPQEWSIPSGYATRLHALLQSTSTVFVPRFREWLDWQKMLPSPERRVGGEEPREVL